MDPNLLAALRVFHFLGFAVWFGGALSVATDVRKTLTRGKPHTDVLADRVDRQVSIGLVAALITIGSGLGMLFGIGGFAAVGPRIHAGLSLALVALAVELFGLRPAIGKLRAALAAGKADDLRAISGRIAMLTGIGHSLKLVTLLLMVFRIGGK
jgi:uncharacterized membrane protein